MGKMDDYMAEDHKPKTRKRSSKRKHKALTSKKAHRILRDGEVKGHALTKKQRGFFGARAGKD